MKSVLAILILWIPFSIAAIVSVPVLLWAMLTDDESVWRPVGKAMDRLLAALLGFSPDYTLSAQLGFSQRMQWLRKILDMIQAGHCAKATKEEGLL